ncbi:MAG: hypothetical protein LC102_02680 [Ignavibacteriales bacterium]|nr:MAG: hypothetical protein F9K26_06195 [Ignavibacteriaceae bacterium]MBW7874208.1 hypothetical protein [Ignavibacteria bacterium]MBZ0195860.1 hypothetical protein [Ignavibacteriaceae bacterium]MCZ2142320.1 hypothetical protein [Ignavibacteriales bacterium]WKZ73482.1 MAG: hypothetical protein QY308_04590 [Ignavibacteriaceae bacterium]
MKRKNFITLFLFVFFLTSTGIPQVIHECSMTGTKSITGCSSCGMEESSEMDDCCTTNPTDEPSCCTDEISDATVEQTAIATEEKNSGSNTGRNSSNTSEKPSSSATTEHNASASANSHSSVADACTLHNLDNQQCCSEEIDLVKIVDNYSVPDQKTTGNLDVSIVKTVEPTAKVTLQSTFIFQKSNSPPLIFGKQLLFSIHQLKIADHLV